VGETSPSFVLGFFNLVRYALEKYANALISSFAERKKGKWQSRKKFFLQLSF
jgi:hypothetical protein